MYALTYMLIYTYVKYTIYIYRERETNICRCVYIHIYIYTAYIQQATKHRRPPQMLPRAALCASAAPRPGYQSKTRSLLPGVLRKNRASAHPRPAHKKPRTLPLHRPRTESVGRGRLCACLAHNRYWSDGPRRHAKFFAQKRWSPSSDEGQGARWRMQIRK